MSSLFYLLSSALKKQKKYEKNMYEFEKSSNFKFDGAS